MKGQKRLLTSWDDGHYLDERVMGLLRKYKLPGLFFIPLNSWGSKNIEAYKGFEIGGHTFTHPSDLKKCDDNKLNTEIIIAKELLEKKIGKDLRWFCYPRGRYNERVIRVVEKAGFEKARTVNVGIGGNLMEIKGYHCYQRKEYEGKDWLDYIKFQIKKHLEYPMDQIHIWGHSWEIEKHGEWEKLEALFKFIKESYGLDQQKLL